MGEISRGALAHTEVLQDPARSLASLEHRRHHQIRAAHHVTAGEHLRVGSLKGTGCAGRDAHAPAIVEADAVLREPRRRARQEAERDDDRVRRHDLLGTWEWLRHAPPARIGWTEGGLHELYALHPV